MTVEEYFKENSHPGIKNKAAIIKLMKGYAASKLTRPLPEREEQKYLISADELRQYGLISFDSCGEGQAYLCHDTPIYPYKEQIENKLTNPLSYGGVQPKTDKEIEKWYLEEISHPKVGDTLDMLISFQRFLFAKPNSTRPLPERGEMIERANTHLIIYQFEHGKLKDKNLDKILIDFALSEIKRREGK